jgi:hypothetical protein
MVKQNRAGFLVFGGVVMALSLLVLQGCNNNNGISPTDNAGKKDFLITTMVGGDETSSSFLGTFKDLTVGAIDNSNSYEHSAAAAPHVFEDIVIVTESRYGDKIYKYIFDSDNNLSQAGTMQLPQGSFAGSVSFAGKTKAYLSMAGIGKVRAFNPTTMETITDIDLSSHAVGENDNNPEPGDLIIRDGKLFVPLGQSTTMMPPSGHDSAWCAIIDIATNSVEKVIIDGRASLLAYGGHTKPIIDENNDLYLYALGFFGYQQGSKEGFLRIKSGETEFDPTYFFSLDDFGVPGAPSDGLTYIMKSAYAGDGVLYSMPYVPGWASNPPDYMNDKNYQPCKINLRTKTIEKIDLLPTAGWSAMGVVKADDLIVFGLATTNGIGLYTYNHVTGESSSDPVVTTSGNPMYLEYLGD